MAARRSRASGARSALLFLLAYAILSISPSFAEEATSAERETATKDLFDAAFGDDVDGIEAALEKGADLNAKNPSAGGQTALMGSVLRGKENSVLYLLDKGADATVPERDGYTPMHGAGFQGRASIAKILSDHGVNLRDKHPGDGHEPAIRACWGGEPRHLETVKFFLKAGVPLDDIYEPCVQMTRNSATKKFLEDLKEKKEEL
uniref:Ankyrin repeat domain-containing protein n=1 Tax=Odontella aurita TaxID=265563 RepID=A0A7S4NIB5_9STRA